MSSRGGLRFGEFEGDYFADEEDQDNVEDERQDRLREFDIEVESRIAEMRKDLNLMIAEMKKAFSVEFIKIPKAVRPMKILELKQKYDGVFSGIQKEEVAKIIENTMAMPPPRAPASRKRKPLTNKTNTVRKSTRLSKAAAGKKAAPEPRTPAPRSSRGRSTAATPAMDPRLPMTPVVRVAKSGESLLSMNGSPIANDPRAMSLQRNRSIVCLPLKNGKVMELDSAQADLEKIKGTLSKRAKADAKKQLEQLQSMISGMLEQF
eukprot:m.71072 g.71072  ORF g.71072 m.71072 type:complete len:263 (+) comp12203_c0_seq1:229-1017(+)